MQTRLEQILKKIKLSKAIDMNFILQETTLDENTISELKESGYNVEQEYFNRYYLISW